MHNTTVDQMKSTMGKGFIVNTRDEISVSKEDNGLKNLMATINFWGNGAYRDELSF